MKKWWRWFLAYYRINSKLVCELSKGRGSYDDYHDYKDTADKVPMHFGLNYCERCGKSFYI